MEVILIALVAVIAYTAWYLAIGSRPKCPQCNSKTGVSRVIGETFRCTPCKIRWSGFDGRRLTYL